MVQCRGTALTLDLRAKRPARTRSFRRMSTLNKGLEAACGGSSDGADFLRRGGLRWRRRC